MRPFFQLDAPVPACSLQVSGHVLPLLKGVELNWQGLRAVALFALAGKIVHRDVSGEGGSAGDA